MPVQPDEECTRSIGCVKRPTPDVAERRLASPFPEPCGPNRIRGGPQHSRFVIESTSESWSLPRCYNGALPRDIPRSNDSLMPDATKPPEDPRVRLAGERTLLAWEQTGLAM